MAEPLEVWLLETELRLRRKKVQWLASMKEAEGFLQQANMAAKAEAAIALSRLLGLVARAQIAVIAFRDKFR